MLLFPILSCPKDTFEQNSVWRRFLMLHHAAACDYETGTAAARPCDSGLNDSIFRRQIEPTTFIVEQRMHRRGEMCWTLAANRSA